VTLSTAGHPVELDERYDFITHAPIVIEDDVWVGAAATITPEWPLVVAGCRGGRRGSERRATDEHCDGDERGRTEASETGRWRRLPVGVGSSYGSRAEVASSRPRPAGRTARGNGARRPGRPGHHTPPARHAAPGDSLRSPHCAILAGIETLAPILPLSGLRAARSRDQYLLLQDMGKLPCPAFGRDTSGSFGMAALAGGWAADCHMGEGNPHTAADCARHQKRREA
jgi:hypothetical protein